MKPGRDPLTLLELQRRFSDEERCLAFLEHARWPHGPVCPRCGVVDRASRITTRPGSFTCLDCGYRFSVTAGTPMHKTHLPICIWIIATYLLATSSTGISALKLSRWLGLQYRTVWHLRRRIRAMMNDAPELMRRIVALDETEMGGKPRATHKPEKDRKRRKGGRGTEKPMAFSIVARGGTAGWATAARTALATGERAPYAQKQ